MRRLTVRLSVILAAATLTTIQLQGVPAFAAAPSAAARAPGVSASPAASGTKPKPKPPVATGNSGLHGKIVPGATHGMPTTSAAKTHAAVSPLAKAAIGITSGATSVDNLQYAGGPVMHRTTTYLIFWDPGSATIAAPVKTLEAQFLSDLGGPYYNILNQYYEGSGTTKAAIDPLTDYGGSWEDTATAYPHAGTTADPVMNADVQQEIQNAINSNPGWTAPGPNTLYEVVTGPGVELCSGTSTTDQCTFGGVQHHQLCAYHGSFTVNGVPVIYANDANDAGRPCSDAGSSTPNDSAADADVSTMSHETFEAITDPQVNVNGAWYTPTSVPTYGGQEIGDLCAYDYGPQDANHANLTMNGHSYLVQREWSNAASTATSSGCTVLSGAIEAASSHPACTANQLAANDDGSTGAVTLPFTANFFSQQASSLFVNNNGNVTFDGPQSTYTPYGLLSTAHQIIAPYFADVDTRGAGSGLVTYGSAPAAGGQPAYFCVDWINVGYYGSHTDKLNSFQMLMIDRSAQTGTAGDFDIVFNYDKVQWETGDASGGSDGLGGSPAVVGYSNGTTKALQLPGSAVSGAFEDSGPKALTQSSQGSQVPGRYIYPVRNGSAQYGGAVQGLVTGGGAPVAGAWIEVCGQAGSACTLTDTNAGGAYAVSGLPDGTYRVTANPPTGSALSPGIVQAVIVGGDTVEADLSLVGPTPPPSGVQLSNSFTGSDGLPVINWTVPSTLSVTACPGGSGSATVTPATGNPVTVPLTETSAGLFTGVIPALYPTHGSASVSVLVTCPNPAQNRSFTFSLYIDPSGHVVDQSGTPISGATVTLLRSDSQSGPFVALPAGSAIMSPANRANPDTTKADGSFGWDVLTGYYQVQAAKAGCTDPANPSAATVTSAVFQIPPPMTDLTLTLACAPAPDTTSPVITTTPVTIEGDVSGGFTGVIPGISVSDPDNTADQITLTDDAPTVLPLGATTVHYSAHDPAGNTATASQQVTIVDTTAPTITCPPAVNETFGAPVALGTPTVADIVDASPTVTNDAPATFPAGTTTVTWTATDHSGNHASCAQSVVLTVNSSATTVSAGDIFLERGHRITPTAALGSTSATCVAGRTVTFSLDRNPRTGVAGQYQVGSAGTTSTGAATAPSLPTQDWRAGVYRMTVTAQAANPACGPAQADAEVAVVDDSSLAGGAGTYGGAGSPTSHFGFTVNPKPHHSFTGQLVVETPGNWLFVGTVNTYRTVCTSGVATGTGTLYAWDPSQNAGTGGWVSRAPDVPFTAKFSQRDCRHGPDFDTASFGILIGYTPQPTDPHLPSTPPVAILSGRIRLLC